MSDQYDEYYRWVNLWAAAGDRERLQLTDIFHEAFACHETDTDRSFALFTRGRDEAARLHEPWWVLFFECWRLTSLTSHSGDVGRALPLAMQLMVQFNSPIGRGHDWRNAILVEVLNTYLSIDPVGYREEIERGFAHLDGEILLADRYVFNYRRVAYHIATDRWDTALDLALRALAEANQAPDPSTRIWHEAWTLFQLCSIYNALGNMDLLAAHAEHMAELSRGHLQLRRTQAAGLFWLAVTERTAGKEKSATSHFHKGIRMLRRVVTRDMICADPIAKYHELGADYRTALKVRERELAEVAKRGLRHDECDIHVKRCRLLALLNELTPADLDAARQATGKLRVPEGFLNKLDRIESGGRG